VATVKNSQKKKKPSIFDGFLNMAPPVIQSCSRTSKVDVIMG